MPLPQLASGLLEACPGRPTDCARKQDTSIHLAAHGSLQLGAFLLLGCPTGVARKQMTDKRFALPFLNAVSAPVAPVLASARPHRTF